MNPVIQTLIDYANDASSSATNLAQTGSVEDLQRALQFFAKSSAYIEAAQLLIEHEQSSTPKRKGS